MTSLKKLLVLSVLMSCVFGLTKYYEAFNKSCIDSSYLFKDRSSSFTQIKVPTFNDVHLEIDLRHLNPAFSFQNITLFINITNLDLNLIYNQTIELQAQISSYHIGATNNLAISCTYRIQAQTEEETIAISYLLEQSISASMTQVSQTNQVPKTFLFAVTSNDLLNLPYNMMDQESIADFKGYYLTHKQSLSEIKSRQKVFSSYSNFWNGISAVRLPYLPYFSNCQNAGQFLQFSDLIKNSSECKLYGSNSIPINQFKFGSQATADTCNIKRECIYDQDPTFTHQYPTWNTLSASSDSYLFYVSAKQMAPPFSPTTEFDQNDYVKCLLMNSAGTNTSNQFPMRVSIKLGYYQRTQTQKQMLTCEVSYSLFVASSENMKYHLDISLFPLNHTKILLNFGFKWYVYIIVFIIIGLVSNLQFIVFWIYHLATTIKPKAYFNLKIYLRLIKQIIKGVLPAFIIIIILAFVVQFIMNGTLFGDPIFTNFHSFWDYLVNSKVGYFAQAKLQKTREGRMGLSYMIISSYLMLIASNYLIGKQRKKQQYLDYQMLGRLIKPKQWNQSKFLFGSFVYILICMLYLYFTYTEVFSQNIWLFIAAMQIIGMIAQEITSSIYNDQLPCIPLKITLGVLSYLATMGAIDLYYFILGYLIDVAIATIETAYLSQLQSRISNFIQQKMDQIHKFYLKILNAQQQQEQDNQDLSQKQDELQNQKDRIYPEQYYNEVMLLEKDDQKIHDQSEAARKQEQLQKIEKDVFHLGLDLKKEQSMKKEEELNRNQNARGQAQKQKQQFQAKKFQLVIDLSCNMVQYMVQPMVVLILWITYNSSGILSDFNISKQTCILYLLSSIILAVFYQINVIIIFHILELYLNFDYKNVIKQLLSTSQNKTTFWITDQNIINNKLEMKLRGTRSYSLHPQMFLLVALFSCSIYLFIVGFNTLLKAKYNPFKDTYSIFIAAFWLIVLKFLTWLLAKIAFCLDIWGYASLQFNQNATDALQDHQLDEQTLQIMRQQSSLNSTIKFTFKNISPLQPLNQQFSNSKSIMQSKLNNICKKLKDKFQTQEFRLEYAIKNKQFIRQNLQKILPLVKKFPQDDAEWLGKRKTVKQEQKKKKKGKHLDSSVSSFLQKWMKRAQMNRLKRQASGVQSERALKKCNFCFNTWNIYFGYDGMCLACSKKLIQNHKKIE